MLYYNQIIAHNAVSLTISMWGNICMHVLHCSCRLKANVMKSSSAVNAPSSSPYAPVCPSPHCQALLLNMCITTTLLLTHYNTHCNTHFKCANWHGESFIILGGKHACGSFDQWWASKGEHPNHSRPPSQPCKSAIHDVMITSKNDKVNVKQRHKQGSNYLIPFGGKIIILSPLGIR